MSQAEPWVFPGLPAPERATAALGTTPLLIRFYDPTTQAKNHHGQTLEDILQWDNVTLELRHNYIQTLFPLPEVSGVDSGAPLIDQAVFEAFRNRSDLQAQLRRSFYRMLNFYGFVAVHDENNHNDPGAASIMRIVRAPQWQERFKIWAVHFDHNHQRITRILRCLRLLDLKDECRAFFDAVKAVFNDPGFRIGHQSLLYWTRAIEQPLYIMPQGGEIKWLKAWERRRAFVDFE